MSITKRLIMTFLSDMFTVKLNVDCNHAHGHIMRYISIPRCAVYTYITNSSAFDKIAPWCTERKFGIFILAE